MIKRPQFSIDNQKLVVLLKLNKHSNSNNQESKRPMLMANLIKLKIHKGKRRKDAVENDIIIKYGRTN